MRNLRLVLWALLFLSFLPIPQALWAQEKAEILWRYPSGGRLIGLPAWVSQGEGGTLYALAEDRHLYAFTITGRLLWKIYLTNLPTGPLGIGRDGSLYFGLTPSILGAVSPRGTFIWKTNLKVGKVEGITLSERGLIFAGTEGGWLFCLDHRGRIRWQKRMTAPPSAPPVYALGWGGLYTSSDQRITAFSPGGENLWTALLAAPAHTLLPLPFGIATATSMGTLSLFDYRGKILWTHNLGRVSETSLLGGEQRLVLKMGEGRVLNFFPNGERGDGFPSEEGQLFLVGPANTSLVLNPGEGRIKQSGPLDSPTYTLEAPCTGAVIADGEVLFTGGKDWKFRAYHLPFTPQGPWSQMGGDGQRSYRGPPPQEEGRDLLLMDRTYLFQLADSPEEERKLQALEEIGAGLREKKYTGTEPSLLALVERLAGEGRENPLYQDKRVINDFPRVRWEAAALLGKWGDLVSRETLLRIFASEWESRAAVAQAHALGRIGSDPSGEATRLLASRVKSLTTKEERLLWGGNALEVLGGLIRYNGDYPDPAGFRMVFSLYQGDYGKEARKKARKLLES